MPDRRFGRRPAAVFLGLWAAALSVVVAVLMQRHWVPLPRPGADDPAWARLVRDTAPARTWTALHVLSAECECSRRVFRHLAARPPEPGFCERIVWVTEDDAPPPTPPAGFEVEQLTPAALRDKYAVESAPLLVVLAADGRPRYAGGYTVRKQGPAVQDRAVFARLMAGEDAPPLPVFGCRISNQPLSPSNAPEVP